MAGFEFPMGNIQMVGKSQGPMFRGEKPIETALAPQWSLEKSPGTPSTSGSRPKTCRGRRTASPSIADGNITLSYTPSNQVAKQKLYDKLKSMLNQLDMHDHLIPRNLYMKNEIDIGGVAHQAGTCRFGTRPEDVGARHELQGPRARQSVRRRHQLFPQHRRGEPGAHRDGQCAARRRSSARTTDVS